MKKMFALMVVVLMIMVVVPTLNAQEQSPIYPVGQYSIVNADAQMYPDMSLNGAATVIPSGTVVSVGQNQSVIDNVFYIQAEVPNGAAGYLAFKAGDQTGLLSVPPATQPQAATDTGDFVLPSDPANLLNSDPSGVGFVPQLDNCRDVIVIDNTCSSRERQPMSGKFDLKGIPTQTDLLAPPAEAMIATGDGIEVLWTPPAGYDGLVFHNKDGQTVLYPDISEFTGTDAYAVFLANNSHAGIDDLVYNGPNGSYHGFFQLAKSRTEWSPDQMAGIVFHQARMYMFESDPAKQGWLDSDPNDPDGPYEALNPANCSAVSDLVRGTQEETYCGDVNFVVMSWDGTSWTFEMIGVAGVDAEAHTMTWTDFSSVLGDIAALEAAS